MVLKQNERVIQQTSGGGYLIENTQTGERFTVPPSYVAEKVVKTETKKEPVRIYYGSGGTASTTVETTTVYTEPTGITQGTTATSGKVVFTAPEPIPPPSPQEQYKLAGEGKAYNPLTQRIEDTGWKPVSDPVKGLEIAKVAGYDTRAVATVEEKYQGGRQRYRVGFEPVVTEEQALRNDIARDVYNTQSGWGRFEYKTTDTLAVQAFKGIGQYGAFFVALPVLAGGVVAHSVKYPEYAASYSKSFNPIASTYEYSIKPWGEDIIQHPAGNLAGMFMTLGISHYVGKAVSRNIAYEFRAANPRGNPFKLIKPRTEIVSVGEMLNERSVGKPETVFESPAGKIVERTMTFRQVTPEIIQKNYGWFNRPKPADILQHQTETKMNIKATAAKEYGKGGELRLDVILERTKYGNYEKAAMQIGDDFRDASQRKILDRLEKRDIWQVKFVRTDEGGFRFSVDKNGGGAGEVAPQKKPTFKTADDILKRQTGADFGAHRESGGQLLLLREPKVETKLESNLGKKMKFKTSVRTDTMQKTMIGMDVGNDYRVTTRDWNALALKTLVRTDAETLRDTMRDYNTTTALATNLDVNLGRMTADNIATALATGITTRTATALATGITTRTARGLELDRMSMQGFRQATRQATRQAYGLRLDNPFKGAMLFSTSRMIRGRSRTKGRVVTTPTSDLFSMDRSFRRFGSANLPVGKKAGRQFATALGSSGVLATFPTAELMRGGRPKKGKGRFNII